MAREMRQSPQGASEETASVSSDRESDSGLLFRASNGTYEHCKCDPIFEVYKDRKHINCRNLGSTDPTDIHILGSIGEFCGAFYHVPQYFKDIQRRCLTDRHTCKVASLRYDFSIPRTVVALVRYELKDGEEDGTDDIVVKYTNCYCTKQHAEDYLYSDIFEDLSNNDRLRTAVQGRTLKKITIYITLQPCHKSVERTPKKSCCDVLLKLHEKLPDVEICIKPTHIYKADWVSNQVPESTKNAKEGIIKLTKSGINISRMKKEDWDYLWTMVNTNDENNTIQESYQLSERIKLDEKIHRFLQPIKVYIVYESESRHPHHSNCGLSESMHYVTKLAGASGHLFQNESQFCAFYHVFEQDQHSASCLSNSCPYQRNNYSINDAMIIVVKCEDDEGIVLYEAMYTGCKNMEVTAEELFYIDIRWAIGKLFNVIEQQRNKPSVTMYTTWLPRLNFTPILQGSNYNRPQKLCIKTSHLYNEDAENLNNLSVRSVMEDTHNRLTITGMADNDWAYLNQLNDLRCEFDWIARGRLDTNIKDKLIELEILIPQN